VRNPNAKNGSSRRLREPTGMTGSGELPAAVLCFSHLRWNFVFQRPQHLMARFARTRRVFFIEEPVFGSEYEAARLEMRTCPDTGVVCVIPHLPDNRSRFTNEQALQGLLDNLKQQQVIVRPLLWYYTPAMLPFSRQIENSLVVYDCMDELANFLSASPQLPLLERELMRHADVVFTGGHSLYEAKRALHDNIHPFPSSVDREHFAPARSFVEPEPDDQVGLPRPRLGYYGVLDERIDFPLVAALADARPDWSIVMVGPLAKIRWDELPIRPNLHYLGGKPYAQLPNYVAGWEVALMPFAINEATRFISPTKTPEYLASGRPVVSTPVTDVVRQYGNLKCVRIAHSTEAYIEECVNALEMGPCGAWLKEADTAIEKLSWNATFVAMGALIKEAIERRSLSSIRTAARLERTRALDSKSGGLAKEL
jgi:UDP-galactopyranose mutase